SDWAVFETQATTTTLATSGSPVEVDTLVTFTATVEPSSVPGSVAFFADGASLGSVTVAAGEAQTSTAGLAVGTRVITAIFTP
ncbi:MAG: Ig-like domain repeat protein, partial [Caldilineaceae bacterium]|nr:Ig-like domain repeat protein [Caldilineaceae bacterium]